MKSKKNILTVALLAAAALILVAAVLSVTLLFPVSVYTMRIAPGTVTTRLWVQAEMEPSGRQKICSTADERIIGIPVEVGDKVEKGDILAIYETGENQEFEYIVSQILELRKGYTDYAATGMPALNYTEQNKRIKAAESAVEELEKTVEELRLKRESGDTSAETDEAYISALTQLEQQKKLVEDYKADLEKEKAKDQQMMQDTVGALDYLNKKTVELQDALKNIDSEGQHYIASPVSGTVESISAVPGSRTAIGGTVLTVVTPESGYDISIDVPSEYAEAAYGQTTVPISSYYWDYELDGKISAISGPVDGSDTRTVTIHVKDNPGAGHAVSVPFEKETAYNCVVPSYAVHEDAKGKYVYLYGTQSLLFGLVEYPIAFRQNVTVLEDDGTRAAIGEDLTAYTLILGSSGADIWNGKPVNTAKV